MAEIDTVRLRNARTGGDERAFDFLDVAAPASPWVLGYRSPFAYATRAAREAERVLGADLEPALRCCHASPDEPGAWTFMKTLPTT